MVKLTDYLYSSDTVLKILYRYLADLTQSADQTGNEIDKIHCQFLHQIVELLEHNDFLTTQSQRINEFYHYMAKKYPFLAFSFKGRIKSLIRAEAKFNGYIVEYVYDYYEKYHKFPDLEDIKSKLTVFRDLVAYRIVISVPKCHLPEGADKLEIENEYLYKIAGALPDYLQERGFSPEPSGVEVSEYSKLLAPKVRPYYRDYILNHGEQGYQSLHITLYDHMARCYVEVQLRTKEMDDYAEIGPANHLGYEKRQEKERARREAIPYGECLYFDEAYERGILLQQLELSELDVNMFSAANNSLINDDCGLYRGRLILPYEHLSRFQSDDVQANGN